MKKKIMSVLMITLLLLVINVFAYDEYFINKIEASNYFICKDEKCFQNYYYPVLNIKILNSQEIKANNLKIFKNITIGNIKHDNDFSLFVSNDGAGFANNDVTPDSSVNAGDVYIQDDLEIDGLSYVGAAEGGRVVCITNKGVLRLDVGSGKCNGI